MQINRSKKLPDVLVFVSSLIVEALAFFALYFAAKLIGFDAGSFPVVTTSLVVAIGAGILWERLLTRKY